RTSVPGAARNRAPFFGPPPSFGRARPWSRNSRAIRVPLLARASQRPVRGDLRDADRHRVGGLGPRARPADCGRVGTGARGSVAGIAMEVQNGQAESTRLPRWGPRGTRGL